MNYLVETPNKGAPSLPVGSMLSCIHIAQTISFYSGMLHLTIIDGQCRFFNGTCIVITVVYNTDRVSSYLLWG